MSAETAQNGASPAAEPPGCCQFGLVECCCLFHHCCSGLEIASPTKGECAGPSGRVDVVRDLHVIQLTLIGLVAVSVLLLADSFGRAFRMNHTHRHRHVLVFFSAYDTLAGIGTGLAMRSARSLSAAQQEGVFLVVKDWPGLAWPFALSIVGTAGG